MNKPKPDHLRIVIAQLNFLVGDLKGNANKIIHAATQARDKLQADLIVFPELALTGYPPEDLLYRNDFHQEISKTLAHIQENTAGIDVLIGYPERRNDAVYNAASVIRAGKILVTYHKQQLPNYGVFDEKRYFKPGSKPGIFQIKGLPICLLICEDVWFKEPIQQASAAGAKLIIVINASPFDIHKVQQREKILKQRSEEANLAIIYAHSVGGQDEILFDGRSIVVNENQEICAFGPLFEEKLIPVDLSLNEKPKIITQQLWKPSSIEEKTYKALVTAVRDYVQKNHFPGVLLGLSGGIDSALTLAIAIDALGADKVHAVQMPSRYTAAMSIEDAKTMAENVGVKLTTISIEPIFSQFLVSLAPEFADTKVDVTEENLQARIRGALLMALSNKFGKLVLTTGNKSEMAVGYATLYGDMAGGFAVLKDVYKTMVYALANYRNNIHPIIPQRIIDRLPSAELALEQTDQDFLPPYPILDKILERYVEHDESIAEITAAGFGETTVRKVIQLVDRNEYKRRQAPPGPKITARAFGRDRRYPITNGFRKIPDNLSS